MDKKIQAQMAENLERKQQGEQFKILDPARILRDPLNQTETRFCSWIYDRPFPWTWPGMG